MMLRPVVSEAEPVEEGMMWWLLMVHIVLFTIFHWTMWWWWHFPVGEHVVVVEGVGHGIFDQRLSWHLV